MTPEQLFESALCDRGISHEVAKIGEIGLLVNDAVVGYFPYAIPEKFKGKIGLIFPVKDLYGSVVSYYIKFPKNSKPKYDSVSFAKNSFFGLNIACPFIVQEQSCILVEGPMDVFSLWTAGFRTTIGALGTSVKFNQLCLLRRFVKKCFIVFDGDETGSNAAKILFKEMSEIGITGYIVSLPNGLDPDDYIKTYGTQAFQEKLKRVG